MVCHAGAHLCQGSARAHGFDRGIVGALGPYDTGSASGGGVGVVGDGFVVEKVVVPVHGAVGGGDGEGVVILVDGLAREVLEHDVDFVGVLDQGHGVDVCAFVFGEYLSVEAAVVEALDVGAHGAPVVAGLVVALHGACEAGVVCGFGHVEVRTDAFAAPCQEVICAGSEVVDVHEVAFFLEGGAAFTFLPYDVARLGVDDVESDGVDLVGECVGKVEVPVEAEAHFVVGVAVAFVVVDEGVAGGECHGCECHERHCEFACDMCGFRGVHRMK